MALLAAGLPDIRSYKTPGNTPDGVDEHPGPLQFVPALLQALTGAEIFGRPAQLQ